MSTLLQLRNRAMTRYRDLSNINVTTTTWDEYLNEGYSAAIADSPFWPFLETSTSALTVLTGTNEVTLPTDGWRVLSVYNNTNDYALDELDGRRSAIDAYPDRAASTGEPILYRLFGNKLQVFPWAIADTTLIVEYAGPPVALATDDSPVFPNQYHDLLLHYALEQAFLSDAPPNLQLVDHHGRRWRETLGQMRSDLLGARGDSYPQIVDSW